VPEPDFSDARVPIHLRQYVVEQDYDRYDEVDQAVWRFILLHTYGQLRDHAHPAYADGFGQAGMRVDRIPRVSEMDRALSRFGWGAVCVDGFIPPRAFQELQAQRILPIAAEIRRSNHLAYTPAPDIVHEAAGHAPIVADPQYAGYLQRIGEVGSRAFSLPQDVAVQEAVRALSVAKERVAPGSDALSRAEATLAEAIAGAGEVSEAAQVARLHWWTVEYGLVGAMDAPRLYGAGLLSSLGEGHACLRGGAEHRPLSLACVETAFDITRPQPQLFVVPSLGELVAHVNALAERLAQRIGGRVALSRALQSEQLATLRLDGGLDVMGTVVELPQQDAPPAWVRLAGRRAIADAREVLVGPIAPEDRPGVDVLPVLPLGPLADGRPVSALTHAEIARAFSPSGAGLRYASGVQLSGRLQRQLAVNGRPRTVELVGARVERDGRVLLSAAHGAGAPAAHALPLGGALRQVVAGATLGAFHPEQPRSGLRAPAIRPAGPHAALDALYSRGHRHAREREALLALRRGVAAYPSDWLLRWNLLESLLSLGVEGREVDALANELRALEVSYAHREPIAMGLRSLGLDAA